MAVLNKKEKIILNAAQSNDLFLHGVFENLLSFYKALSHYLGSVDYDVLVYLYCRNHKKQTFQCIADNLHISVSCLEEKRAKIVEMFFYFMAEANAESIKAS